VLPAIVAGEDADTLRRLERLSASWGLAYQILDDFKDSLMGVDETGKTAGRDAGLGRPNLPDLAGPQRALGHLRRLLAQSRAIVDALGMDGRERWAPLASLQGFLEAEARDVARRLDDRVAA
ncbi:MAG TPA: polyprenyl synthetase family protein, partial [Thermoanaerobaculia bacterium]